MNFTKILFDFKIAFPVTLFSLALSLNVLYGSGSENKNDWPKWRGQNQDGKALQKGVFNFDGGYGLKIAWKKPLGSGYSSVSIADGRAFTMFSDSTFDYVIAFDTDNGDQVWRYTIDSTYIGHDGSSNGPISTPLVAGDKVYGLGRKGHLFALDVRTGERIWWMHLVDDNNANEPYWGFATSPVIDGDVLIVETGGKENNAVSGFNKDTGELLWATGTDTVSYQSPISINIAGQKQLIFVGDKYLYALDLESGKILWEYRHKGDGATIGGQSINPVMVDVDKLLLGYKRDESILIQITKKDKEFTVEEVWKSRNIRGSYNVPVYFDGYLYGYSGRFITCVDANTGETVWKSRPPGDSFLILVDDHLVILTKQGTMHVAEASPEDYKEMASLQVFGGLTWTPPSFANGSIYARNLYEVARIDIAKVDQLTMDEPEIKLLNPNGKFVKFVKKVEASDDADRKRLLNDFMKSQKSFPVIEDERFVHIVYHGEAKDIAVIADMLNVRQETVMTRINGTDFFFASFELESDARVNYQIRKDFDNIIADPLNPYKAPGGPATMQGEASELRMPKSVRPNHFDEPNEGVARGNIETFEFESKILKNKRKLHVYLPAGYADSKAKYPVIYVNYGNFAKDMVLMPNTLDNLIGSNRITPIIAVFVEAPQSFQEYSRNLRDQHAQMFSEELVPYIDQKFRTLANPDSRLFMGGDEGGFAAFYAAFKYPEIFHNVAGQSTHLYRTDGGDALTKLVSESPKLPFKIYMDWGKYDLLYINGLSWVELNKSFVELLKEKGYSVAGGEANDGFGWASWRNRTDKILETFFPLEKTQK